MKRALCIWLPAWPLQRLAGARAELSARAVVLYRLQAAGGARVVAYCPRLASAPTAPWQHDPRRTAGIRAGMPLAEATALAAYTQQASADFKTAGDCPDFAKSSRQNGTVPLPAGRHSARPRSENTSSIQLAGQPPHLELADPLADRVALAQWADWCKRYSPTVGLEDVAGEKDAEPESLLLDVTGLGRLFGGEGALARQIVDDFSQRGVSARVAIADTPGAAWALARFAPLTLEQPEAGEQNEQKKQALDPCDEREAAVRRALAVPLIVPEGCTRSALAPLPVEALRLPGEVLERLAALGLERIEQVAALPRATLLARFGPVLLARLDRATGAAAEAIVARSSPREWSFAWPFEYPTAVREMIEFALAQLIDRACGALARERYGLLRLECRFEHEDHAAERFVVGAYRPSANPRHVEDLVRLKLESLRFGAPVATIVVAVLAWDRLEFHQQEMFSLDHDRDDAQALAGLVDRLSNRLGLQAVVRPWLLASAQPEYACQYVPLAALSARPPRGARASGPVRRPARRARMDFKTTSGATAGSSGSAESRRDTASQAGSGTPSALPAGDRPCHLEPRPRLLSVVSVAPEGPPMQFRLVGQDQRVVRVWGPERIETGWWRWRLVRRDYYQVETASGRRYWLFRQLQSGAWFLHGAFE